MLYCSIEKLEFRDCLAMFLEWHQPSAYLFTYIIYRDKHVLSLHIFTVCTSGGSTARLYIMNEYAALYSLAIIILFLYMLVNFTCTIHVD